MRQAGIVVSILGLILGAVAVSAPSATATTTPAITVSVVNYTQDLEILAYTQGSGFIPGSALVFSAYAGGTCHAPTTVYRTFSFTVRPDGTFVLSPVFTTPSKTGSVTVCVVDPTDQGASPVEASASWADASVRAAGDCTAPYTSTGWTNAVFSVTGSGFPVASGYVVDISKQSLSATDPAHWAVTSAAPRADGTLDSSQSLSDLDHNPWGVGEASDWYLSNPSKTIQVVGVVTPDAHRCTTTLSATAPVAVGYGQHATVTANLTTSVSGAGVAGARISLYQASSANGTYTVVTTANTTTTGVATASVAPGTSRFYKWIYAGDATHASSSTSAHALTVSQLVACRAVSTKIKKGTTLTLWGTVSPNETNQYVYLQAYYSGAWHSTTAKAKLVSQKLPDGTTRVGYILKFVPAYTQFRAYRPTTATNGAGYSGTVTITLTK